MEYDFFNKESGSNSQLYSSKTHIYMVIYLIIGSLKLPVLGSFELEGKTLSEANNIIQLQADKLFFEPSVKVNILNYYVNLGEVQTLQEEECDRAQHQSLEARLTTFNKISQ